MFSLFSSWIRAVRLTERWLLGAEKKHLFIFRFLILILKHSTRQTNRSMNSFTLLSTPAWLKRHLDYIQHILITILSCLTSRTDLHVKEPHDGAQGRDAVLLQVSGPSSCTVAAMLARAENTLHSMQANCEMHQAVTLHSLDSNARHKSEVKWLHQTCLSVIRYFRIRPRTQIWSEMTAVSKSFWLNMR